MNGRGLGRARALFAANFPYECGPGYMGLSVEMSRARVPSMYWFIDKAKVRRVG
jgi:hypothetical protein